jgi:hypothetical protein
VSVLLPRRLDRGEPLVLGLLARVVLAAGLGRDLVPGRRITVVASLAARGVAIAVHGRLAVRPPIGARIGRFVSLVLGLAHGVGLPARGRGKPGARADGVAPCATA